MTDPAPLVGVIMGSDSDLRVMQDAIDTLDEFGVSREVHIVSAHRTPERMFEYARSAVSRGLRVIIAGAGGAAHLQGMTASLTPLPVIGVPVPLAELDGLDSLLSIVQMPNGVPVATVGIGKARNAALLALRILGTHDDALRARMEEFQTGLTETVLERDANFGDRSS
jgi:5-(carboxyamino)imidazole ribonucleotide mutase